MGLGSQIKMLFRLFLLFTVLVAVALLSAITTIRLTVHGRQEVVPNLVGRPLESAQRISSGLGLELKVEGKLFNSQYQADQVVSQSPAPGTRVKAGQHLHVMVSLGSPQVKVPDVVGTSVRAAQITAVESGLNIGDVVDVHWAGAQGDVVVAQEPLPSTTEVHSPALNFLVSLGAAVPAYECPNFVGVSVEQARRTIEEAGFQVGQVTPIPSSTVAPGTILIQSPAFGTRIESGAALSFEIAAPPELPPPPATALNSH